MEYRQAWDAAKEVPIIQDEQKRRKLLSFIQFTICTFVALLVFVLAFFSKTSLLLLISITNEDSKTIRNKAYACLFTGCTLVAPSVLILIKSVWKITFKDSKTPSWQTFTWVVLVETLVALGSSVLTLIAMPNFDILTNVMLLNGIAVLSAVLQVVANSLTHGQKNFTIISVAAVVLLLAGYVFFAINYLRVESWRRGLPVGLAIGGMLLVSLNWWENYAMLFPIVFFNNTIRDIKRSRNMVNILSSLVRIAVTAVVVGVYVWASGQKWASVLNVHTSTKTVVLSLFAVQVLTSALCRWVVVVACKMHAVRFSFMIPMIFVSPAVLSAFVLAVLSLYWKFDPNVSLSNCSGTPEELFNVQDLFTNSSYVPYVKTFLGSCIYDKLIKFLNSLDLSCIDMLSQNLNTTSAWNYSGTFAEYCGVLDRMTGSDVFVMNTLLMDLTPKICNLTVYSESVVSNYILLGISSFCWWAGLVLCTLYIWFLSIHRIERTKDMFVRNLYEAAFVDQSMLLNTRFEFLQHTKHHREKDMMHVNLCATMWHETYDEMMKMIISMFRLDKFRPKKHQFNDVNFESHIYFDDAFLLKDGKRHVNEYAETLVEVIREVYIIFTNEGKSMFKQKNKLPDQKIIRTPYGCRVQYTLPQGNSLFIHFKDKHCIRHKKRWSQIMYLYYLLGWRLNTKYYKLLNKNDEPLEIIENNLKKEKENTYILALDGDTDFQPSAVMLLVDRLRLYPEVGAACGRIHPTGTGPMVWYQKFEYAVGHWLQKTAEHVFGCVLCSPGCFSLFRAAALMDDNVMKRYTTRASEAIHYVQYDQGEDRWLCTLLLQQGWRVEYNAASDSYTNAPQEFKEFYNQRRRWGPSTMANTLDLLGSGTLTAQRNKSISRLYILYQIITMGASLLGPATVCLMIAGCFSFVFKIDANLALLFAILPPAMYLVLCFYLGHTKSNLQISIAAIMSIFYAFLMTATILSIIAGMVLEGTFMTPSGMFFIGIIIMYTFTALLHPQEFHLLFYGLLYMITIPSGYLLLVIYSMVNMNNVSWGTRESGDQGSANDALQKNVKCQKVLSVCGYNMEFKVSQDVKVSVPMPLKPPSDTPQTGAPVAAEAQAAPSEPEERQSPASEDCFIKQLIDRSDELLLKEDYLHDEEERFWKELIKLYLKPLETEKAKEDRIKSELKSLRNKAAFVFFIVNALWLVATFFLQLIGNAVNIRVPKYYINGSKSENDQLFIDPIGLMFLISFTTLLVIQFFAMLWHRVQTLIHFIAYNGTEARRNKKMAPKYLSLDTYPNENIFL